MQIIKNAVHKGQIDMGRSGEILWNKGYSNESQKS